MIRLFVLSLLLISLSPLASMAQPKLKVSSKEFVFGWTPHSSTAVTRLTLMSAGTDTLLIHDITSTCPCLTMPLAKQSLPPGDSLVVPMIWVSDEKPGAHNHYLSVYCNDPEYAERKLIIKMKGITVSNFETLMPVSFSPYRLEFARMGKLDIDSIPFTISNNSTRDLEISVLSMPSENFEIVIPDYMLANSVDQGYAKLKLDDPDTELEHSVTITIKGDNRYEKNLTIPIRRKMYSK